MNSAVIYGLIMEHINMMGEQDRDWHKKCIEKGVASCPLVKAAIALKDDIKVKAAKASGKANAYKSAQNVIKSAKRLQREDIHGSWVEDGKWYVTDTFRVLEFDSDLNLPVVFGIKGLLERIFPKSLDAYTELEVPSIAELKAYIKTQKAENKNSKQVYLEIEPGHGCNASYLVDILSAYENVKVYGDGGKYNPFFFVGDGGRAILMPLKK